MSKNLKNWREKNSKYLFLFIYLFIFEEKKYVILLVLLIEEISIRPELSSPPRFRTQGEEGQGAGAGQDSFFLILYGCNRMYV